MKNQNHPQNTQSKTHYQEAVAEWENWAKEHPLPDDIDSLKKMLQTSQIKALENELHLQKVLNDKNLLWSILDTLPNAVFVKDIQNDYRFCLWNKKAEELFGLSAADCLGKSDYDFFAKQDADWFRQKDIEVSQLNGILDIPEEVVESENKTVIVHTQKKVVRNENGIPSFLVGVSEDITVQKEMALALQESEALAKAKKLAEESEKRLKEAQHIALIGYWELNMINHEEIWSEELYKIFELEPYSVQPSETAFLQNLHPDDRDYAHQTYLKMTGQKQPYEISYRLLLHNGKIKYVNERCRAEFDESGKHIRSIGTLQDITNQKINEDNLRKSIKETQDLKYALDQSAMVVRIDKSYKVMTANANFCKISGFKEEELIGQNFNIADLEYHSKWFMQNIWATVQGGAVWKGELKNRTKTGFSYWTDTAIVPFIDELHAPFQYIVIQRDITEEKRLQEELELANEAEFAKLYQQQKLHIAQIEERGKELDRFFNLSMDMISVITFDGHVKRINPAFLKVLGYSQEELMAKPLFDLIHPNDLARTYAEIAKMEKGLDVMNFENRYRTKEGDYRWLAWRTVLDKEAQLCYAITRDITDDRKAIKEIEDLKLTLDQTAIVMTVSRDEKILSVNDKFCEISGYSRDEVIGQHHEILDSLHHSSEFWTDLRATIESGRIWQGEIKERAKNGSFYWTYTSSVPFLDEDGKPFQYIVIQSDITERKKLEEALHWAKEEAIKNAKIKEDFLANMSHEIRTPMNGVLGFARLLLQTNLEPTQQNYAQSIYNSAENLLAVVNDILDVSKIESGKLQLEEIEFDLEKRIHDTLGILKIAIEKKQLDLRVDIDKNIPKKIVSVPNRLSQILINLIGNSVKFTKTGFIQLKAQLADNQTILFEVTDSGIGIPEDKLDIIFDSFTQAASYTTREHGGTGLGLSICKKLVLMMGGEISVKSQLGKGTTFSFTLPFKSDNQPTTLAIKSINDKFELIPDATNDTKILVVEDNLVNQELALIYLNILNCNCDLASNGVEALSKLSKQSYDLVLMDIQMPQMDGIAATIEIRKNDSITPIVAMTAHALSKEKEKCFEIGMNDYISKPFKIEDLQEVILKHTKGYIKLYEKKIISPPISTPSSKIAELDFNHLVQVMDNNQQLAKEILGIFKKELIKFSDNMKVAIQQADMATVRKQIHKIKPNFELLKLLELYEIAEQIHHLTSSLNPNIQEIEQLYLKIDTVVPLLLEKIDGFSFEF